VLPHEEPRLPSKTFDTPQTVDRAQWKQEIMSHEKLFLALHDHLPERIYEREANTLFR
jgi:phosphoenolpyruvate carboxykinase (GTP)